MRIEMSCLNSRSRFIFVVACFGYLLPCTCQAGLGGDVARLADGAVQNVENIYHKGKFLVFLPGYTWHDPKNYSANTLAKLNSAAWGLGFGKQLTGVNGNNQILYAMVFSDSYRNAQYNVGYDKQWVWNPVGEFYLGVGGTLGITSRPDILHGIPIPLALPVLSIGYGPVTLYGTFIPKISFINNGNVAFFFASCKF